MSKLLRQHPILYSGDTGTSIGCARQYHAIAVNEGNREDDIFRDHMGCSVLK